MTKNDPISLFSQVMLAALAAQVEWGDWKPNQEYNRLVGQVLPMRIIAQAESENSTAGCIPDQVNMHHQSLQGMAAAQAKEAFLTLIQSWSLYRATIFDVTVSPVDSLHDDPYNTPEHLLLDRSLNIGPLISRWELDKIKNC
jgi:hypothetical protein